MPEANIEEKVLNKKLYGEVITYHKENKVVNYIMLACILVVVLCQISQDMPVLFGWNVNTVNYYKGVAGDLSIGYLVSAIFYILVVYYPQRKKQLIVKTKTSILFARLQTQLGTITSNFVNAIGIEVDASSGLPDEYNEKIDGMDVLSLMSKVESEGPWGTHTYLDEAINASAEIESLKTKLIPFLAYMDHQELDLYTDLEEIFIFENMDKLSEWPPKESLFTHEFSYIVSAYYKCQKVVTGHVRQPVKFETESDGT
ncbi:hypothetical protein [Vibrio rotiferianus]|uniref:hypothetical protein n=1 Tax=Vibrio rotiferianus TaxID=190895 RepID=UPI00391BFD6D